MKFKINTTTNPPELVQDFVNASILNDKEVTKDGDIITLHGYTEEEVSIVVKHVEKTRNTNFIIK